MGKNKNSYNVKYNRPILLTTILSINIVISVVSGVFFAEITRRIINTIIEQGDMLNLVYTFGFLIMVLAVLSFLNSVLSTYIKKSWINSIEYQVVNTLTAQYFYSMTSTKEYFSIIRNTVRQLCDARLVFITTLACTITVAISTILYIGYNNLLILCICFIFSALVNLISYKQGKKLPQSQDELNQSINKITQTQLELISNREIIPFLNNKSVLSRYLNYTDTQFNQWIAVKKKTVIATLFNQYGGILLIFLCFILWLVWPQMIYMDIAQLVSLFIVIPQLTKALFNFPKLANDKQRLMGLDNTLRKALSSPQYEKKEKKHINDILNSIEFQNVTCCSGGESIVNNFSALFKKGEITAIVGEPGSGKSSILKLICQLFSYESGDILLDGNSLQTIDRNDLWSNITYMPQIPLIFPTTVEDNIVAGRPYSKNRVIESAKTAGIEQLLSKDIIPDNLSSGEKQKLAFARVLYRHNTLLLLDEPTAALDPRAEAEYLTEIYKWRDDCIIIMVTHKSASIKIADTIVRITKEGMNA